MVDEKTEPRDARGVAGFYEFHLRRGGRVSGLLDAASRASACNRGLGGRTEGCASCRALSIRESRASCCLSRQELWRDQETRGVTAGRGVDARLGHRSALSRGLQLSSGWWIERRETARASD